MPEIIDTVKKPLPLVVRREQVDPEDTIVAYACGTCGVVHKTENEAGQCHGPDKCERCGALIKRFQRWCSACECKIKIEEEQERFAKVEKVTAETYSGPIYYNGFSDNHGDWGDGFWSCLDVLIDYVEEDQEGYAEGLSAAQGDTEKIKALEERIEMPEYVYACTAIALALDAYQITEDALGDHHESAADALSDEAVDELQTLLDEWCKEQDITSYEVDESKVILIPAKEVDHDAIKVDVGMGT